jgi:hypothetical protein
VFNHGIFAYRVPCAFAKHYGVIHYDCVCLRGDKLDKKIRKIYSSYKRNDFLKALKRKNALKQVEKNQMGRLEPNSKLHTVFLTDPNGLAQRFPASSKKV